MKCYSCGCSISGLCAEWTKLFHKYRARKCRNWKSNCLTEAWSSRWRHQSDWRSHMNQSSISWCRWSPKKTSYKNAEIEYYTNPLGELNSTPVLRYFATSHFFIPYPLSLNYSKSIHGNSEWTEYLCSETSKIKFATRRQNLWLTSIDQDHGFSKTDTSLLHFDLDFCINI